MTFRLSVYYLFIWILQKILGIVHSQCPLPMFNFFGCFSVFSDIFFILQIREIALNGYSPFISSYGESRIIPSLRLFLLIRNWKNKSRFVHSHRLSNTLFA